ncbi:MAG TPA: hypothetical protein VMR18_04815 [Candidatus Saccharimonadales bacterium]|nr:hypothetical protein [Candidatus Saccharimonadales bacterium]
MSDESKQAIADTVLAWCNECRLQAAKMIIWNAEIDEVEQIAKEAEGYLRAIIGSQATSNHIRSLISELDHKQMRAIRAYISLLLEGPCKTPECQEDCNVS